MYHCLNPQAFTINTNHSLSSFSFLSSYYCHLSILSFSSHLKTLITSFSYKLREVLCLVCVQVGLDHLNLDHLATLTREKCSALVRSCYVPSRTSCNSEDIISNVDDGLSFRGGGGGGGRHWRKQHQPAKRHGGRSCTAVSSEPCRLKSNLKIKNNEADKGSELEQRKVSWPDAHGKDIAHIQEFELSASEDGDNAGNYKRKYCGVCIIQ